MNMQSNVLLENLTSDMSRFLDNVSVLVHDIGSHQLDDQQTKLNWAREWITRADHIFEDIEQFSDRIMLAKNFREISSSESAPLTTKLIEISNALNNITDNMYKINNHAQNQRLCEIRVTAKKQMEALQKQEEDISKLLVSRQNEIQRKKFLKEQEIIKKQKDDKIHETRKKAFEAHKKFVASLNAIEALNSLEENTVIANESFVDEATLIEGNTPTGKKRRSRSLTRKVVGSVKKTIRRSVSFVNNYLDHHHHHHHHHHE